MAEPLAFVGLLIGTLLYFLLVRRRASIRSGLVSMSRALAASNEIALQRLHLKPSSSANTSAQAHDDSRDGVTDRRSGEERRRSGHRRFGRGRRSGGDRRRS